MDPLLEAVRVCQHSFLSNGFLQVALIFIFSICMHIPTKSYAQSGFLSIDCGSSQARYTDSLGLEWVDDNETYIKTGTAYHQEFSNVTAASRSTLNSTVGADSPQALRSFRYFPERRNKFCYELPTTTGGRFLIRASFYMTASVLQERAPFQFIFAIDATNWFTVTGNASSKNDLLVIQEAIFYNNRLGPVTYFCLQPVVGEPFISSLELRPIKDNMYSYAGSDQQYLTLLFRYNIGAKPPTPAVRFPDDIFDRIWQTPNESQYIHDRKERYVGTNVTDVPPVSNFSGLAVISSPTPPDTIIRADVLYAPPKVMQDAWSFFESNDLYDAVIFSLRPYSIPGPHEGQSMLTPRLTPTQYAFVAVYVEDLNTSSRAYSLNISLDGVDGSIVNFSNQASMQVTPFFITGRMGEDWITIKPGIPLPGSRTLPSINAMEVYGQSMFNYSYADTFDEALNNFKTGLSLADWQGDPCTPVPDNWLSCTSYGDEGLNAFYEIKTIYLSNHPIKGFSYILDNTSQTLDSDYWLYMVHSLTDITITNCKVDTKTFLYIYKYACLSDLTTLDLSFNVIDVIPPASAWVGAEMASTTPRLWFLNLAHNHLGGEMNSFHNISFAGTLLELNLSYNAISSLPRKWENSFENLTVLDLSHNNLQGRLSSLDPLVQYINNSLQELYLTGNNYSGPFPSSRYFSALPNLRVLNFDQNSIQGTLNLTIWYNALKEAAFRNSSAAFDVTLQLFSFVDNKIVDIVPKANKIESVVDKLILLKGPSFHKNGVLLGGNPYCKGAKSHIQQYLCRSTINDVIKDKRNRGKNILITATSISGTIIAIIFGVAFVTIWKLWKQLYALRKIQQCNQFVFNDCIQTLASQKVQPPFYEYNELKVATTHFHKDNRLGEGAFGIVYKGVLADSTTVAVKKLFDLKDTQALNDFLNEVVLITGIKHVNLVQLRGCCIKDKQRILVYEYCAKGNLAQALWGCKPYGLLNWEQRRIICVGVARGLSYLHEELQPSIVHRDIKPENILLDTSLKPKIADFGLAKHFDEPRAALCTKIAGTLGYLSPEYATQGQLSDKADVYSYGVVLLEIISGRRCIDPSLPLDKQYLLKWVQQVSQKGLLLHVLQPELRDDCLEGQVLQAINIGLLCVQQDPEMRPAMSQVVTMFCANLDVNLLGLGPERDPSYSTDMFEEDYHETIHPTNQTISEKKLAEFPLLHRDSQCTGGCTIGKPRYSLAIRSRSMK